MKAIDRPFTKIINGTTQFVIPVFQRDYSWTDTDCEQLWKDVLQIAGAEAGQGHFLGSVVYISTGDTSAGFTRWLLIDGQQRVTTITLLLAALRDHITETGWRGGDDDPTAKRVEAYFLKNLEEEGNRIHKLVLRRHDQATLKALLDRSELPEGASERITENYEYFREQLKYADPAAVYRGVGRLIVVDVTLDRATDDPQLIFESLNSTGVDLSQSDLIRNFILMRMPEHEQTRLYEAYWSKIEGLFRGSEKNFDSFARDYIALKTEASKQERANEIYRGFRRVFTSLQDSLGGLEELLADMLCFSRYHAAFSLGASCPPKLAEPLARLRRLVDVPALLVMRLFDLHDRVGALSETQFIEALELMESYVFRRAICGSGTHAYWQTFASIAYKLREEGPLDSLKVSLARQRDSYRFPNDEEFRRELEERDIYGLRVCAYLLDRLENHDNREPTDTGKYSVEHIMPQNEKVPPAWREMLGEDWKEVHSRWLHRLGNLTLTGYNSAYSDRAFEEKKTIDGGFSDSSVRLNKFVREQEAWTLREMQQRGSDLASKALLVWRPLIVSQELVDVAKHLEMRELAARRDVAKVKMSVKARGLFDALRSQVNELGREILELAEAKSVSYHGPNFFLEVLPRAHGLTLLVPLDFNEVLDPDGVADDATRWKFLIYAKYEGGVTVGVKTIADIEPAIAIIRQAYAVSSR